MLRVLAKKMKPVGVTPLSQETKNILSEICAASHISTARSRHIFNYLSAGAKNELEHFVDPSSAVETRCRSSGPKVVKASNTDVPRRRKKSDIEASGSYKRDEYRPPKRKEISVKDKEALLFRMAYGRDIPSLPDVAEILHKRAAHHGSAKDEASQAQRFEELREEVSDRKAFLEEARLLGISGRYEAVVNCEIAQKIKEMESIVQEI